MTGSRQSTHPPARWEAPASHRRPPLYCPTAAGESGPGGRRGPRGSRDTKSPRQRRLNLALRNEKDPWALDQPCPGRGTLLRSQKPLLPPPFPSSHFPLTAGSKFLVSKLSGQGFSLGGSPPHPRGGVQPSQGLGASQQLFPQPLDLPLPIRCPKKFTDLIRMEEKNWKNEGQKALCK